MFKFFLFSTFTLLGTSPSSFAETMQIPSVQVRIQTADNQPLSGLNIVLNITSTKWSVINGRDFLPLPALPHREIFTAFLKVMGQTDSKGEMALEDQKISLGMGHPFVRGSIYSNGTYGSDYTGCKGQALYLDLKNDTAPDSGCTVWFNSPEETPPLLSCHSTETKAEIDQKLADIRSKCVE